MWPKDCVDNGTRDGVEICAPRSAASLCAACATFRRSPAGCAADLKGLCGIVVGVDAGVSTWAMLGVGDEMRCRVVNPEEVLR